MCPRYVLDMPKICSRYVTDMSHIWLRQVPDMYQIGPRYVPDISNKSPKNVLNMSQICPRCLPDISRICQRCGIDRSKIYTKYVQDIFFIYIELQGTNKTCVPNFLVALICSFQGLHQPQPEKKIKKIFLNKIVSDHVWSNKLDI